MEKQKNLDPHRTQAIAWRDGQKKEIVVKCLNHPSVVAAMDDAAKMSQNVSKNINQSMNNTYSTGRNASGTDNWQGGQTWVGEEGPELVTLPRGSKITPADQAGGRSEVNNYYITIDAKNVQDFNRVVELAQQQKMALRRV